MLIAPIVIFLFGLFLTLIQHFSNQLPVWLGQFGILMVILGNLFLPWQTLAMMVGAYLFAGCIFYSSTMGIASLFIPFYRMTWVEYILWAFAWPFLLLQARIRIIRNEIKEHREKIAKSVK